MKIPERWRPERPTPNPSSRPLIGGTTIAISRYIKTNARVNLIFYIERLKMSVISKEQLRRDERSLTIFLICFNITLASAFLLICRYL